MIALLVLLCLVAGNLLGQPTDVVSLLDSGLTWFLSLPLGCTIDASGKKCAMIIRVPKAGTVTKVGFMTGTVTTAAALSVGLETVSTTDGFPTGISYGGSSPGIVASPISNTWYEATLATPASATSGDVVAAVVQFSSTVGNLAVRYGMNAQTAFGYVASYTTSWSKGIYPPIVYLVYSDNSVGVSLDAGPALGAGTSFNSSSSPNERGNLFKAPVSGKVYGVRLFVQPSAGANFDVVLYDASNNVLTSVSIDVDQLGSTGAYLSTFLFPSPVPISAGSWYRVVLKPTTTANVIFYYADFPSSAVRSAWAGDMYHTARSSDGAWTDTETRLARMTVLLGETSARGSNAGGSFAVCY